MLTREEREQLRKLKSDIKHTNREYEQLISHKTDWSMLEQLIQRVNANPDLEISITTRDGTTIRLKTTKRESIDPYVYN